MLSLYRPMAPIPSRLLLSAMPSALSRGACTSCYYAGMKRKARPIQYTIRGVPREVDAILRRKAAQRAQSLNQVVLEELAAATGGRKVRTEFSDVLGRWTPDAAFDDIISSQRKIDPEKWK